MSGKQATIADVAAAAGVSSATVSRALAGKYPVANETSKRVFEAVDKLGYVVNSHARALAGAGQPVVAFILASSLGPGFAEVAHGVAQETARLGRLSIISATEGEAEREWSSLQLMQEQRVEAVIVIGGVLETKEYRKRMRSFARSLDAIGSRLVLCGRPSIGDDVPVYGIDVDHEGGAYAATMHLLAKGHDRILVLTGQKGNSTTESRIAGHKRALEDFGVELDTHLIRYGSFSRQFGYDGMLQRLRQSRDFSAVFAHADTVAAGALSAIRECGLSVPDDLSIVGYDDIELACDLTPQLTTVQVPYEHLGKLAVRSGLDVGTGERRITLGTNIVVRQSVKQVRRSNTSSESTNQDV